MNPHSADLRELDELREELIRFNERFDNVTRALLALVKPEWKREAQLIIDQFKP